jgi:hypothetical protein
MTTTKCPVCDQSFGSVLAMQQHFNDVHRAAAIGMIDQVPDSTVDGELPAERCENCRYWGKGNNLTVCRLNPGVPAMMQTAAGMQCISLYPPKLANEWCGKWEPCGRLPNKSGRRLAVDAEALAPGALS